MRKKVVIVLACSIFVAFMVFYSIMDWYLTDYDPFNRWSIIQMKTVDSSKKIFILGSSQAASLNLNYIENQLANKGAKYVVYDLAIGADSPSLRLGDVNTIISLKPSIVVYGIGFRDFERKQQLNFSPLGTTQIVVDNLLPTPRLLDEKTDLLLKENEFVNKIFKSPKLITLRLFNYVIRNDFGYNYPDITLKTPLIQSGITPIISNKEIKEKFDRAPVVFRGIDDLENNQEFMAFTKILQKLRNNGIKVVVFTVPNNKALLDTIPNSNVKIFTNTLNKISKDNDVNTYFLHDKYANLEIWGDLYHVAYNNDTIVYSDDITKIILKEINP